MNNKKSRLSKTISIESLFFIHSTDIQVVLATQEILIATKFLQRQSKNCMCFTNIPLWAKSTFYLFHIIQFTMNEFVIHAETCCHHVTAVKN